MSANSQDIAHDPAPRLHPLYYLHNFRRALATLKERYVDLLDADEAGFIECFERLREPVQCLLTRLVMRKGPLFRRATLTYAEVADLDSALQELVALGWLDPDPKLCAQDLSLVLHADELRRATGIARGRRAAAQPVDIQKSQLPLPLEERPTIRRSLAAWNAGLAGSVVHLRVHPLINRLQWLFFGNHHQSWAEFVLTELGVKRYEPIAIDSNARAFRSRQEIAHFYRLSECRAALEAGVAASAVRECAIIPEEVSGWLRSQFLKLNLRIGERLEDEGHAGLAVQCYQKCGAAEGLLRAVRLQLRQGLIEDAERDALAAQALPCNEAQRDALERVLARIKRRRGGPPLKRMIHDDPETIELCLPKPQERRRIELAVVERLTEPGSPVFHVENSLFTSLFGLLCWEAIFAPVPGAFFHPFQAAPADLYTGEFRERRALHFRALLGLLESGGHEAAIWRRYRAKAGIVTNFVRWGRLKPPLLKLALQCIPAAHLKLCFERLLDDLADNAAGIPDLIQFWPTEGRYRLLEVKGPGDRLRDNQRRWFRFFAQHCVPAAVCQVRWQPVDHAGPGR